MKGIGERVVEKVGDDGGLGVVSSVAGDGGGGVVEEEQVVVIVGRSCRCMKRSRRVTAVCLAKQASCQVGGIERLLKPMLTAGCSGRPGASAGSERRTRAQSIPLAVDAVPRTMSDSPRSTGANHDQSGRLSRSVYVPGLDATTPDEAIPLSAQQTTREHDHAPELYFAAAVAVEND